MSEHATEQVTGHEDDDTGQDESHAESTPTLEGLAAKVDGLAEKLDRLLGGPAPAVGTAAAADRSVAQEVRDELAKLQAAEKRKQERAARDGKLDELAAKVEKITEQKPVEYRRSTRAMRWDR
jgi:hypothetical protein